VGRQRARLAAGSAKVEENARSAGRRAPPAPGGARRARAAGIELVPDNSTAPILFLTRLVHRADAILADDVPSIPIVQVPFFLAYRTVLHGIAANAGPQVMTWNVEDWQLE
jgi:hypothetical protein